MPAAALWYGRWCRLHTHCQVWYTYNQLWRVLCPFVHRLDWKRSVIREKNQKAKAGEQKNSSPCRSIDFFSQSVSNGMNPFHGLARITEKMFGTPIMLYIAIDTFDSLKRNGFPLELWHLVCLWELRTIKFHTDRLDYEKGHSAALSTPVSFPSSTIRISILRILYMWDRLYCSREWRFKNFSMKTEKYKIPRQSQVLEILFMEHADHFLCDPFSRTPISSKSRQ